MLESACPKRLVFALAFVCSLLAAALVAVMVKESRLEKENERLKEEVRSLTYFTSPERMKLKLSVFIYLRGDSILAIAHNGSAFIEKKASIQEFGLVHTEKH